MKYEKEYPGHCFDLIFHGWSGHGVVQLLEEDGGVQFADADKAHGEFLELLASWHERGVIKPMTFEEWAKLVKERKMG